MIRKGYTFDDLLLIPAYNDIPSRKDVDTSTKFGDLKLKIPLCVSNMEFSESAMAIEMWRLGGVAFMHRFMSIEKNIEEYNIIKNHNADCVVSLGINEGLERFMALYENGAKMYCVDSAHGHAKNVGSFIKELRKQNKDIFIIAGNVATYAGADYLAACGADMIKVGIGSGGHCVTRLKAGVGVSQMTAVMDCARINKPIISDGGIKKPADYAKSIAGGAKLAIVGTLFGGCIEAAGTTTDGFKIIRGLASKEAQENFFGVQNDWKTSEGVQSKVKISGPLINIVNDLMGGLRSSMTYMGANTIEEFQRKAEWLEISSSSLIENGAHGVN